MGYRFRSTVSHAGGFLIRAVSWDRVWDPDGFASYEQQGFVLMRTEPEVRGVLLGYPVHLLLDPIIGHPAVVTAERCLLNVDRGRRRPTRSVRVTLRGQLPPSWTSSEGSALPFAVVLPVPGLRPPPVPLSETQGPMWTLQRGTRDDGVPSSPLGGRERFRASVPQLRRPSSRLASQVPRQTVQHSSSRAFAGGHRGPAAATTSTGSRNGKIPASKDRSRRLRGRRRRRGRGGATRKRPPPPSARFLRVEEATPRPKDQP